MFQDLDFSGISDETIVRLSDEIAQIDGDLSVKGESFARKYSVLHEFYRDICTERGERGLI